MPHTCSVKRCAGVLMNLAAPSRFLKKKKKKRKKIVKMNWNMVLKLVVLKATLMVSDVRRKRGAFLYEISNSPSAGKDSLQHH